MCGIVFAHHTRYRVAETVFDGYMNQRSRGTLGFGIVSGINNPVTFRTPDEQEIVKALFRHNSKFMLFHHRMPTSTANVEQCSHPFTIERKGVKYATVHNGIIWNDAEREKALKKEHTFSRDKDGSANDSEVLAVDLANAIANGDDTIKSSGSVAFVTLAIEANQVKAVYFGRNSGSPLFAGQDKGKGLLLTSEQFLDAQESVEAGKIFCYNPLNGMITSRKFDVPSGYGGTIDRYPYQYDDWDDGYALGRGYNQKYLTSSKTSSRIDPDEMEGWESVDDLIKEKELLEVELDVLKRNIDEFESYKDGLTPKDIELLGQYQDRVEDIMFDLQDITACIASVNDDGRGVISND